MIGRYFILPHEINILLRNPKLILPSDRWLFFSSFVHVQCANIFHQPSLFAHKVTADLLLSERSPVCSPKLNSIFNGKECSSEET